MCAPRIPALACGLLAACAGGGAPAPSQDSADPRIPVAPGARGYPFAASRTTTQTWFGQAVNDDFAWLENPADRYTRSWTAAELAYGRRHLDAMPARAALRDRLQTLIGSTSNLYTGLVERGGQVFALKTAPPSPHPVLVVMKSVDDAGSERVVFDPGEAGTGAIEFFKPSPDGRHVALAVRESGATQAVLRLVDTATGQALPDRGGSVADVAWGAGGGGLFVTRGDASGQVFFHKVGPQASSERLDLGAAFVRTMRTRLVGSRDGRVIAAVVSDAATAGTTVWLKAADVSGEGSWRRLASEADGVRELQFGEDDALLVWATGGAPRGRVLRLAPADVRAAGLDKAATIVAPTDAVLQHFATAGASLFVAEMAGAVPRLRSIDLRTRHASTLPLPGGMAVAALARSGRGEVVAELAGPLGPPWWTHATTARNRRTALVASSDAAFNDCEVGREFATSADGTQVPMTLLRRRGTRADGHNAVLLSPGGIAQASAFDPARAAWLDRGGIVAIAHVRGSDGLGEAWRRDGSGAKLRNGVEDLVAAAQALVQRGVTQPALLGAAGQGDGAQLVAAAAVLRPALFRAVSVTGGAYDLLLAARETGGIADRARFDAVSEMSPQQAVRDGVAYPAVLATLGTESAAAHARKWVARLQQAGPSGRVVLLRTSDWSGQADVASLSGHIDQASDELGFFLDELLAAQ